MPTSLLMGKKAHSSAGTPEFNHGSRPTSRISVRPRQRRQAQLGSSGVKQEMIAPTLEVHVRQVLSHLRPQNLCS
jgi:DNA-binding CsgD family transcriptional regulator